MGFEFKSGTQVIARFIGKEYIPLILETAITTEEQNKGLSKRTSLPDDYGMVFVFRPAKLASIWMLNTLIPLDLIFIKDGEITKIIKYTTPNQNYKLYSSNEEVTEIIEVNAGFTDKYKIITGNKVIFENIPLFRSL